MQFIKLFSNFVIFCVPIGLLRTREFSDFPTVKQAR